MDSTHLRANSEFFPQLLVSVRNASEARVALSGGCDILDVKEPTRGSLGMADIVEIERIVSARDEFSPEVPVSAALGEIADWSPDSHIPKLPSGLSYLKLGTAHLLNDKHWSERFIQLRTTFDPHSIPADPLAWIIVAYADWRAANAPCPADVLEVAARTKCSGLLIDTFTKTDRNLFDWLSLDDLCSLIATARQTNLQIALAGRLSLSDIPRLTRLAPDIVGIRSAACPGHSRIAAIEESAVREFRETLNHQTKASRRLEAAGVPVHRDFP